MKILQRIVVGLVSIDDSQLGFAPEKHYRCNLCGLANAGEMSSSEHIYLYGLPGPREGIKLCPSNIYLVGAEKAMLPRG